MERENRVNLRAPQAAVLATDAARAVINRVLDNAGPWLFLGKRAIMLVRTCDDLACSNRIPFFGSLLPTGLYHLVHSDSTVRERAQILVERLTYSLVHSGKGASSPEQAAQLGEAGGTPTNRRHWGVRRGRC